MGTPAPGKLHDWKDFPKGMQVLVVISNQDDCDDITRILESCNYNVTAYTKGEDALAAVRSPDAPFHAAMVEAAKDGFDNFLILEAATSLPVIMVSSTEDMGLMMKAISLGAADFLQKPFSEEKLRNIWQHVARKAILSSENDVKIKTEQAVKAETMAESADLLEMDFDDFELQFSGSHVEQSSATELNLQDVKLEMDDPLDDINLGDGIVLDGDGSSEFSLDPSIFMSDSDSVLNFDLLDTPETPEVSDIDRENALMLAQVLKSEEKVPAACNGGSDTSESTTSSVTKDKGEEQTKPARCLKATKSSAARKKLKVDWTPDLHQKFVQAVEQLGVDKAIPSRILELMGEKSLTRHNVASHLQKYRSHRKHLLVREAEAAANWNHRRHSDSSPAWSTKTRTPIQPRQTPILPAPPCGVPVLVWGHPAIDSWKHTPVIAPKAWQAPDGTLWQHPAAFPPPWGHGAAPGTPIYPHMRGAVPPPSMVAGQQQPAAHNVGHAPREVVDAVISEALTNPYILPLGLKPPSMESVLSELGRQGISIAAPTPS